MSDFVKFQPWDGDSDIELREARYQEWLRAQPHSLVFNRTDEQLRDYYRQTQEGASWIGPLVSKELDRIRDKNLDQFKRATEIIERVERQAIQQDTTRKVMSLIFDVMGHRTRMVEEAPDLAHAGTIGRLVQ